MLAKQNNLKIFKLLKSSGFLLEGFFIMKKKYLFWVVFMPLLVFSQSKTPDEEITEAFNKAYAYLYTKKDSCYYFFDEALRISEEIDDFETQLQILSYKIYTNGYHYDMLRYRENLKKFEIILSLDKTKENVPQLDAYQTQHYFDQGNYYYKLKQYNNARPYFLKLYNLLRNKEKLSSEDAQTLSSVYNFLASIYKNTGKYELAEIFYKKALAHADEHFESSKSEQIKTSTNLLLAQLYSDTGEFDLANELLKSLIFYYKNLFQNNSKFKNNLVSAYQSYVKNALELNNYKSGLTYLDSCEKILLPDDPFYKKSLILYASIYEQMGRNEKALGYYELALESYKSYHNQQPHQDVANVYAKISRHFLNQGAFEKGIDYIGKALDISGQNFSDSINPKYAFSKRDLLSILDLKNQNLLLAYDKTQNKNYLDRAIDNNRIILSTIGLLKKEFDSKLDKQFLIETAYPIIYRMLDVTYELYSINSNIDVFELGLQISEKSKDILLLDAFRDANATKFKDVPEIILDKASIFKTNIALIEKSIFSVTQNPAKSKLNDSLNIVKEKYYEFLDSISRSYPRYYDLKYNEKEITVSKIQKYLLEEEQLLISYQQTSHFIYSLVLGQNDYSFSRSPIDDEFTSKIEVFRKEISKPSLKDSEILKAYSEGIYKVLLKESLSEFNQTKLIVIPSGIINYIPFESLLDEKGNYLIENRSVSYNSSINSFLDLTKRKNYVNNNGVLAFAPNFEKKSPKTFGLQGLPYNKSEVKSIGQFYDINLFVDDNATLRNFLDNADRYDIVHLATHASANDEYPDYSYLAFFEVDTIQSKLYIKDLYNIKINAELVCLSACQTGIGKLRKGEGMISLSRGFYYAGAKSLLRSIWKVNDKSTSRLMNFFYEELENGSSKDEALRQAKLKYLDTTEDALLKQPYYWAGFTISGDISSISQTNIWPYLLAFIGISILIIVLIKRKRLLKKF